MGRHMEGERWSMHKRNTMDNGCMILSKVKGDSNGKIRE